MALRQTLRYSKTETFPGTDGSEQPDWSDLPPDLICLIARKIADISDFVRFRVVCKRWRSAVRASDLAPQLPWIIHNVEKFQESYLRFYSLLTGKTYTVNVPQSPDSSVRGSAYNHLLAYNWHTRECSLFNPLTKEELSLPPGPAEIRFSSSVPSGPSPDPSSRYVVISRSPLSESTPLFFCRPGDHEWTEISGTILLSSISSFVGEFKNSIFTFYEGRCYASDFETRSTKVIDLATHTVIHVVPPPERDLKGFTVHLVASFGLFLRVCQYGKYLREKTCSFRIYRLELSNTDGNQMEPCWIEIDNISNQFLFLHDRHGCAFRAEDFPGFVGNSIYYSKENFMGKTFQLFRYDIKEKKNEGLPGPVNLGNSWFVPSLC